MDTASVRDAYCGATSTWFVAYAEVASAQNETPRTSSATMPPAEGTQPTSAMAMMATHSPTATKPLRTCVLLKPLAKRAVATKPPARDSTKAPRYGARERKPTLRTP